MSMSLKTMDNRQWQVAGQFSEGQAYRPEENPYQSLMVDVTHRCNMNCSNCYIPNRTIPDMDLNWLGGILARLPERTRIRLTGATSATFVS